MIRRGHRSVWQRAAVSAVVAYALLLQAFLLSMTGGAHAVPGIDPQGIICAYDGTAGSHEPSGQAAHTGLCCILGCQGSSAPPGPAPADAVLALVQRPAVFVAPSYERGPPPLFSFVLPVGSRAPPRGV
ncbi:hypothetical protein [Microvirga pudoricolor]|uniref:hypothetical protein n=1 Tax=Microvirga pudoricolor TaxID=2778729 RepID=UPI00194FD40F|nr:hypothetical protein [Microvirga pudoricolor]MBM6593967.1 hypothetical protein [Microvirga pudoricolor]